MATGRVSIGSTQLKGTDDRYAEDSIGSTHTHSIATARHRHRPTHLHRPAGLARPKTRPLHHQRLVPFCIPQSKGIVKLRRIGEVECTRSREVASIGTQQTVHVIPAKDHITREQDIIEHLARSLHLAQRLQHQVAQASKIRYPAQLYLSSRRRDPA